MEDSMEVFANYIAELQKFYETRAKFKVKSVGATAVQLNDLETLIGDRFRDDIAEFLRNIGCISDDEGNVCIKEKPSHDHICALYPKN